jgi:endonuclease YncB( thermonuclease family)
MNETPMLIALAASAAVLTFTAIGGASYGIKSASAASGDRPAAVGNQPATKEELAELAAVALMYSGEYVQASQPTYYVDADTFDIPTHIAKGWTVPVRVRLKNVNAPELKSFKCPKERDLALQSLAFVKQVMGAADAKIMLTEKAGNDRYDRYLATVSVNGMDLGQMLIKAGLARPWTETHEGQTAMYWCEDRSAAIRPK